MLLPAAWLSLRYGWRPFEPALGLTEYLAGLVLFTPLPLRILVLTGYPMRLPLRAGVARPRADLAETGEGRCQPARPHALQQE